VADWLAAAGARTQQPGIRSLRERTGFEFKSPASLAALTRLIGDLGWFALGCLLPYGLTCLVLWWAGVFHPFIFWTITYASKYAAAIPLVNGPDMLRGIMRAVVGPNLLFWLLPWIGALVMWWEDRLGVRSQRSEAGSQEPGGRSHDSASRIQRPRFFLIVLLFCSFASTSVGLYFREHYFITVLPVLALLTGVAVSRALHLLKHDQTSSCSWPCPSWECLQLARRGAPRPRVRLAGKCRGTRPRGAFSARRSLPKPPGGGLPQVSHGERRARGRAGSEPEIYFLSGRRSASGYIYAYP